MEKNLKKGISMVSAVSKALDYKKDNPKAENEEVMKHIMKFISIEGNEKTQKSMIAAVSKALSVLERNPSYNNKKIMEIVVKEIPDIIDTVDRHN